MRCPTIRRTKLEIPTSSTLERPGMELDNGALIITDYDHDEEVAACTEPGRQQVDLRHNRPVSAISRLESSLVQREPIHLTAVPFIQP